MPRSGPHLLRGGEDGLPAARRRQRRRVLHVVPPGQRRPHGRRLSWQTHTQGVFARHPRSRRPVRRLSRTSASTSPRRRVSAPTCNPTSDSALALAPLRALNPVSRDVLLRRPLRGCVLAPPQLSPDPRVPVLHVPDTPLETHTRRPTPHPAETHRPTTPTPRTHNAAEQLSRCPPVRDRRCSRMQ